MRISVPSWVIPGSYAENLRFLADKAEVSGVELLFFMYDEEVRALFERERAELSAFRDRFDFTVHLPDSLTSAHEELVEATAELSQSWVVHPGPVEKAGELARLIDAWRKRYGDRFYLENTRMARLDALRVFLPDAPLCMDTGHLLLEGFSPAEYARANGGAIKEIHLHGLGDGGHVTGVGGGGAAELSDGRLRDHRTFLPNEVWYAELEPLIRDFAGIIDIEVFSWTEAQTIIRRIRSEE